MASPEPAGSVSGSSLGLENISLNRCKPHPEQWTLPHEWQIEKRELYEHWKLDLQSQISHIDKKLGKSLQEFPAEEVAGYRALTSEEEEEQRKRQISALRGQMQHGIRRS